MDFTMSKIRFNKFAVMLLTVIITILPLTVSAEEDKIILTIIHVNDRHGRMNADPYISQLAGEIPGNILILDAGDALHGQITANLSEGASMVELMNEVGYSAMAVGNHEFNYGLERLEELSEMMDFPLLAANVKTSNGNNLFQSYEVFVMDGVKVGVFGLTTPETISASDPRIIKGLIFDDPVKTAELMVETLKDENCDIIIALTHMGIDDLSDSANRSNTLAKVSGIDVIIDGHSHTTLENGLLAGDTLIVQTGEYGQDIGVVEITVNGENINKTAKLIPVPTDDEESELIADKAILNKISELDAANESVTSVLAGYTPVFLNGEKEAVRTGETNLANLITDSMRYATDADIAFLTGGNIRASIEAGNITVGQVLTTLPYSNLLVTVKLSGAELLEVLEHGISAYPDVVGQHIQVSGLRFEFDPKAESMNKITKVTMADGNELESDKSYTVATIEFLAAGGDGYDMITGKEAVYYQGDAEAFINYISTNPEISKEAENRVMAVTIEKKTDLGSAGNVVNPDTGVEEGALTYIILVASVMGILITKKKKIF